MTETCRYPSCSNEPESGDYCSDKCRVRYEHIKADARDAMRAEQERIQPGREP